MPKSKPVTPELLEMLAAQENRWNEGTQHAIGLAVAATALRLEPALTVIRYSARDFEELLMTHRVTQHFDPDTNEFVVRVEERPAPKQEGMSV